MGHGHMCRFNSCGENAVRAQASTNILLVYGDAQGEVVGSACRQMQLVLSVI